MSTPPSIAQSRIPTVNGTVKGHFSSRGTQNHKRLNFTYSTPPILTSIYPQHPTLYIIIYLNPYPDLRPTTRKIKSRFPTPFNNLHYNSSPRPPFSNPPHHLTPAGSAPKIQRYHMSESIPSVDLRDYLSEDPQRKAKFVQDIGKAYEDIGFVALKGHFLSDELAQRQYASQRKFFSLPPEVKQKYCVPNGGGQRGYTSFGREHAQGRTAGDLKEFWHFGQFLTQEERDAGFDYFPNVLVDEIPDFNTNGQEIFEQLEKTAVYVMRALALFLDLDENFFDGIVIKGNSILRSIHYPPITEEPKEAVRAGAHTDINLITLLMGAQGRGLQVKRNDGVWVEATAAEDELVINVGDMLSRMTNNRLKSTVHQVVNPDQSEWGVARYSMPFFCHAIPSADLSVLPSCIDEDHPKLFEDITAGAFLMQRLIEIGLIKKEDVQAAKEVIKF